MFTMKCKFLINEWKLRAKIYNLIFFHHIPDKYYITLAFLKCQFSKCANIPLTSLCCSSGVQMCLFEITDVRVNRIDKFAAAIFVNNELLPLVFKILYILGFLSNYRTLTYKNSRSCWLYCQAMWRYTGTSN